MLSLIVGGMMRSVCAGPCAILAGIMAMFAIFGCVKCARFRMRDCACCKRFLRGTGADKFDDFELMVLVHNASFEAASKTPTVVRITAGCHHVRTDPSSKSIFQQPVNIFVEQGTETVLVELLDTRSRVLGTLELDSMADLLNKKAHQPERTYNMKAKTKGVRNPKIKLTIGDVTQCSDVEQGLLPSKSKSPEVENIVGLLAGKSPEVENLVRLHLANIWNSAGQECSEWELLKEACSGPVELFERLGKTRNVYCSIVGPPVSRRWVLGIWADKKDFDARKKAEKEVDMLRIQSVQADHTRHHVFLLNFFDESRLPQSVTFRRIDRARDVWVEVLHLLVSKVREAREQKNKGKDSRDRARTK